MIDDRNPSADLPSHATPLIEWQTMLLLFATYGAWLAVTFHFGRWPLWLVAPLAAVIATLHSSLQHELVHGQPVS